MAGYQSEGEALNIVRDGKVSNLPIEAECIKHVFVLGEHVAEIKGKMTDGKAVWKTSKDADLICNRRMQTIIVLYVIHMNNHMFLVSVCSPLELTLVACLQNLKESSLG